MAVSTGSADVLNALAMMLERDIRDRESERDNAFKMASLAENRKQFQLQRLDSLNEQKRKVEAQLSSLGALYKEALDKNRGMRSDGKSITGAAANTILGEQKNLEMEIGNTMADIDELNNYLRFSGYGAAIGREYFKPEGEAGDRKDMFGLPDPYDEATMQRKREIGGKSTNIDMALDIIEKEFEGNRFAEQMAKAGFYHSVSEQEAERLKSATDIYGTRMRGALGQMEASQAKSNLRFKQQDAFMQGLHATYNRLVDVADDIVKLHGGEIGLKGYVFPFTKITEDFNDYQGLSMELAEAAVDAMEKVVNSESMWGGDFDKLPEDIKNLLGDFKDAEMNQTDRRKIGKQILDKFVKNKELLDKIDYDFFGNENELETRYLRTLVDTYGVASQMYDTSLEFARENMDPEEYKKFMAVVSSAEKYSKETSETEKEKKKKKEGKEDGEHNGEKFLSLEEQIREDFIGERNRWMGKRIFGKDRARAILEKRAASSLEKAKMFETGSANGLMKLLGYDFREITADNNEYYAKQAKLHRKKYNDLIYILNNKFDNIWKEVINREKK